MQGLRQRARAYTVLLIIRIEIKTSGYRKIAGRFIFLKYRSVVLLRFLPDNPLQNCERGRVRRIHAIVRRMHCAEILAFAVRRV